MEKLFTIARKDGSGAIIWTEAQKRFIIQEYVEKDNTLKNLSEMFQVGPKSIRNLLRKENIKITNKKTKNFPRISNFFEKINTADKAYWLGFLYADGTIHSSSDSISLEIKDKEHVEKFREALGALNNKITVREDTRFSKTCLMYNFTIHDSQLHSDLIKWGCIPNKSYLDLHFPKIPEELKWHFIRGLFDGDGCLSYSFERKRFTLSFTGGKTFMEEVRHFFGKDNISLCQNVKSKITYSFRLNGQKQVTYFLNKIYEGSSKKNRLNRKYEHFLKLLYYSGANTFEPVNTGCE